MPEDAVEGKNKVCNIPNILIAPTHGEKADVFGNGAGGAGESFPAEIG
jgi:hypothetical protein